MTLPQQPGSPRWRILHSLWILPAFVLGMLTWASFFYIGARTGKRAWLIAGLVYLLVLIGIFVGVEHSGPTVAEVAAGAPPKTGQERIVDTWTTGVIFANWIAGFAHVLLIRTQYLELLWIRLTSRQTMFAPMYPNQVPPQPVYPNQIQPQSGSPWLADGSRQYWAPQPAPQPASTPLPGTPWQQPAVSAMPPFDPRLAAQRADVPAVAAGTNWGSAGPGGSLRDDRVDVNSATAEELVEAGIPVGAVVAVVNAREHNGPLRDLRDFASVTGLKPHELQPFANRLAYSETVAAASASRGRKLDL
ncbi:helix-hairpin-helix domain-containing protein [Nocardia sp. NPDC057663]|uniref:helix-hairpin-helix domain-containing protein n=1 Tax=Nocardia sp. NPDC057663 TaxID=3346201 RepID=UPI00366C3D34